MERRGIVCHFSFYMFLSNSGQKHCKYFFLKISLSESIIEQTSNEDMKVNRVAHSRNQLGSVVLLYSSRGRTGRDFQGRVSFSACGFVSCV